MWIEESSGRRNFETVLKLLGEAEVTKQNRSSKLDVRMKFLEKILPLSSAHSAVTQYNKCMCGAGDMIWSILDSFKMEEMIEVSEERHSYAWYPIPKVSGMGLMKYGNVVIPFDNTIEKGINFYNQSI